MATRYSRHEFLDRLRSEIDRGRPLVMTGAGNGIAAKFIERGNIDILGVYNTGYFRMQGYGSLAGMLPMADANQLVFEMASGEILPQVKAVPVVAGINGVDVLRDMRLFLDDCRRIGLSGVHNFPTVGWFNGDFRATLEATGLGFENELRMLRTAKELDLLTIGYAFNREDTEWLIREADPDIYIFHAGITRGGATGRAGGRDLQETAEASQAHFEAALAIKPELILLAHGAALADPADAEYLLEHTVCHGVQLGSAIERLAIEEPIERRAISFKSVRSPQKFVGGGSA
jgi:predicted TIM-barrel enzyme